MTCCGQPARGQAARRRPQGAASRGDLKGRLPTCSGARKRGRLQGTCKGLPSAASPTASRRSDASRMGGRPLAGRLQRARAVVTCAGAAAA
ncbi:hypothetical protein GW17_00018107 [Ensete ventricosum]|nr:hypothetical protein GW17_00018107 [Ensete ventricosum]